MKTWTKKIQIEVKFTTESKDKNWMKILESRAKRDLRIHIEGINVHYGVYTIRNIS